MQYFVPSRNMNLLIQEQEATVWQEGRRVAGPLPIADALAGLGLRKNTPLPSAPTVQELATWGQAVLQVVHRSQSLAPRKIKSRPVPLAFTYVPRVRKPKPSPPEVGFDLGAREQEVRNILFKLFKYKLEKGGFDHEETVQEVMLALAIRNKGRCPWDAKKSSWGHYVYMVIEGTLCNMARRAGRRSREIPDGLTGRDDEQVSRQDLQVAHSYRGESLVPLINRLAQDDLDRKILSLLGEGVPVKDVASHLGMSKTQVQDRLIAFRQKVG